MTLPDRFAVMADIHGNADPRQSTGWQVAHHHVPYDPTRMVALARKGGRGDWAVALESGRIRG